jgi:phosphate starvation-inducible PhoH-like protein
MRGRSLENCLVICDEAQNANYEALKMIMSRVGINSKLFLNGDLSQIDLRPKKLSGLADVMKAIREYGLDDFAFVEFTNADCQRHPMVVKILNALEKFENNNNVPYKALESEHIGIPAQKSATIVRPITDPRLPEAAKKPRTTRTKKTKKEDNGL